MKKFIWLASYPKSGNTWIRAFLSALIAPGTIGKNFLNDLIAPIAATRLLIEDEFFLETSELNTDETENLRPLALRSFAASVPYVPFFMKVHDAYTRTVSGEYLYPPDVSIGAIYIVRNPLDVVVSYAHHRGMSCDEVINDMNNRGYSLGATDLTMKPQLHQKILSWSEHVQSWTKQAEMPVLCIRYEDMASDSLATFRKIVAFSGLQYSDEDILQAIENSSFDKLKKQEQDHGFREKPQKSAGFFRQGKPNAWQEALNEEQVMQVIAHHFDTMRQFGYIDIQARPVLF